MTIKMDDWDIDHPAETGRSVTPHSHKRSKEGTQKIDDWYVKEAEEHDLDQIKPFSHPNIDPELTRWFIDNSSLRTSVLNAVEHLRLELEGANIRAYVNRDIENPSDEYPCIEVKSDIDDPEQWIQLKSDVRRIVRAAETGDVIIYTNISRI